MDAIKLTDTSIEITNSIKTIYNRGELLRSRDRLQMDLNKIIDNFQARIDEIDILLIECDRLLPAIEEPLKG